MHSPEALILRRCYPVPVTFADLRRAYHKPHVRWWERPVFTDALKEITGAIDEVYAVVDGREVRVAVVNGMGEPRNMVGPTWQGCSRDVLDLLLKADRAGYWERPHEVRIALQERPVSHGEVARAVLVGQEYVERNGGAR